MDENINYNMFIENSISQLGSNSINSSFNSYLPNSININDDDDDNKNLIQGTYNLTIGIVDTYTRCNPDFKSVQKLPQRVLTNPSIPTFNNGADNSECNLICRVHDILESVSSTGTSVYTILDLLGTGTFGQVFRCQKNDTKEICAVKVIKNKTAYHTQGILEIKIAKLLNKDFDPNNEKHIVRLIEYFEFKGHICIVFELLSISLLDILTQNQFRGLPLSVVQRFTKQIISALVVLQDANIVHCDLKPENILLCNNMKQKSNNNNNNKDELNSEDSTNSTSNEVDININALSINNVECSNNTLAHKRYKSPPPPNTASTSTSTSTSPPSSNSLGSLGDIKVIDFGSACYEGKSMYSYIQSRFYRSPEVLLGIPYNGAIDMWSLACVCSEMYLGLPLFPGVSQHNQLTRIVEMFGSPPDILIEGKNGGKYFTKLSSVNNNQDQNKNLNNDEIDNNKNSIQYRLKTAEEYATETNTEVPVLRKYLRYSRLDDVIIKCPLANKNKLTSDQKREEMNKRLCFLNFLQGLFTLNPLERLTAKQAASHPFITNESFTGSFQPPLDPKVNERKLNFLVNHHQKSSSSTIPILRNTINTSQSTSSLLSYITPNTNSNESQQHQFTPLMRRGSERGDSLAQPEISPTNSNQTSSIQISINQEPTGPPRLKRGQPVHIQRTPVYVDTSSSVPSPSKYSSSSLSQLSQYYSALTPQQQQQQQQQYSAYSSSLHSSSMQQYQNQHQIQSQLINNNQQNLQQNPQQSSYKNQTQQINIKQQQQQQQNQNYHQQQASSYSGAGYTGMPYAGSLGYSHHQMMQSQYSQHQLLTQQNQHQQFLRSQSQTQASPRSESTTKGTNSDTASTSSGSNSGSASSLSSIGTSFGGFGGSMQDNGMIMTDFGQALMRPELDERRKLQSNPYLIQQQQFQYMKNNSNNNSPMSQSYGSYDKDGGFIMQAALLKRSNEDRIGSNSNSNIDLIKSNNNNVNNNISNQIITSKIVNNEFNKEDSDSLSAKNAWTSNNIQKDNGNNNDVTSNNSSSSNSSSSSNNNNISLTNSNSQKSERNLTNNTRLNDSSKLNKSTTLSPSITGETDALADWDPFFNSDDHDDDNNNDDDNDDDNSVKSN